MDMDAMYAVGTVLKTLGGLLEDKGVCTAQEWSNTLSTVALEACEEGAAFPGQAQYLGVWAYMVRIAAEEAQGGSQH